MITTLALGVALSMPLSSTDLGHGLDLSIDACVDADREEVVRLLKLELSGAAVGDDAASNLPPRVRHLAITCTTEPDMVELTDLDHPEQGPRMVDLRALGVVARKARARELSLVIRELVDAPIDEPAAAAQPTTRPTTRQPEHAASAELSLLGGVERYSGGYAQLRASAALRVLPLGALVLEVRLGVGAAAVMHAPAGDVSAHSFSGALGAGLSVFPSRRSAGLVVLGRVESDWVFIRGTSDLAGSFGRSANGLALIGNVACSAWLALNRQWRLTLEPALLIPFKQLSILDRGRPVSSISGIGAAANLGLSLRL